MDPDWIARVNKILMRKEEEKILSGKIIEVEGRVKTEYELIKRELENYSVLRFKGRDVKLAGLGNPNVQRQILAVVADYKKELGESRFVKPLSLATIDDIVVMPLRPELFGLSKYEINGVTANSIVNIIPQEGQAVGPAGIGEVTSDGYFKIDPKKARIIYTDFVEVNPSGIVTAIQGKVDDRQIFPYEIRYVTRFGEFKDYALPSIEVHRIKAYWKAKAEFDGTTELTPVGVAIVLGEYVPNLVS